MGPVDSECHAHGCVLCVEWCGGDGGVAVYGNGTCGCGAVFGHGDCGAGEGHGECKGHVWRDVAEVLIVKINHVDFNLVQPSFGGSRINVILEKAKDFH